MMKSCRHVHSLVESMVGRRISAASHTLPDDEAEVIQASSWNKHRVGTVLGLPIVEHNNKNHIYERTVIIFMLAHEVPGYWCLP